MKILNRHEFEHLMENYPEGGIVFAEYKPDRLTSDLMVTDGAFGAREVIPVGGEIFHFDWNIKEYPYTGLFAVFESDDILVMIQALVSGVKAVLH